MMSNYMKYQCCLRQCTNFNLDANDSIKLECSSFKCDLVNYMHVKCYKSLDKSPKNIIASSSLISTMETKKYPCKCGSGFLRKLELNNNDRKFPPKTNVSTSSTSTYRNRSESYSSGTSSSVSQSPPSPSFKFDFNLDKEHAAAGNIFRRRTSLDAFEKLPMDQQNSYHIKLEDEGPHGNDCIRKLVLCSLTKLNVTNLNCVLCCKQLPVFDQYPLIDGTLFLSPYKYDNYYEIVWNGNKSNLTAVCLSCLQNDVRCKNCGKAWNGRTLQIGTMYTYDIFAADQCCSMRSFCNRCSYPVLNNAQFFSDFSKNFKCPHCSCEDSHYIKPLARIYSY